MKDSCYDITYIGMALVDSIIRGFDPTPISASGFAAESDILSVGGEAVNGAIAARKLDLRARILCSLGQDEAGEMVIRALQRGGVDIDLILRSSGHPTPVTTMFVNQDGTRKSITNHAHHYNYHPECCTACFENTRCLALASLFRAPFDDVEVVRRVLSQAHEHGAVILADTKLPNSHAFTLDDIGDSLSFIDYIFPNEDEAAFYSGKTEPENMADVFLNHGVKNVIIKLGGKGCLFKNEKERIRLDSCKIDPVDATGAGDNFMAGFAAELLRGAGHLEALRFANVCGAICTTAVGASAALKNREQVRIFLRERM